MSNKNNLLLFYDRPTEPCYMPKGADRATFLLPDNYYPSNYERHATRHANSGPVIPVKAIDLPDLAFPMELPYDEIFSVFVPKHCKMAQKLIGIFMSMPGIDELISVCAYCQIHINPYLFNYCLSVAIVHRCDTKGLDIPTIMQTFPEKFFNMKALYKAYKPSSSARSCCVNSEPVTIPMNFSASDKEPEQCVAYFREDIGLNLHHWHWHLVNPFHAPDPNMVKKDRRGELFYYMHQQMVARFNAERFCNGLGKVKPFEDFRAAIPEGYFSKLDSQLAGRVWPPRFPNVKIQDLNREDQQIVLSVSTLESWRDKIVDAIRRGFIVLPDKSTMVLDEKTGIDVLGNLVESSTLSPNRDLYGNLHNMGHLFTGYAHDPDNRYLEPIGVMGETSVAVRDPIFFRWHGYLDDIFVMHKEKLTPYPIDQLDFPGILVSSISVEGPEGQNTFTTQWEQSTVALTRGLDFSDQGSVLARFTHLQHDEFSYVIEVNNTSKEAKLGMFRIFLAPTVDEKGSALAFEDQRRLWIELDKFQQMLNPSKNTIRRRSVDSSVTIPYERTFREQWNRPGEPGSKEAEAFDFCGCGWPHHLLLPKGTKDGYPMELFVMISDGKRDVINQDTVGVCNDAASYCGLRDRLYPDRQAMGYPFDRRGRQGVTVLADFLTPNMAAQKCSVKFSDNVKQRKRSS